MGLGDKAAASAFQAELEPGLTRIVQRVLRGRCCNAALQARIITEVSRVSMQSLDGRNRNQKELATQVARSICNSIVEDLRAEPGSCAAVCDTIAG